MKTLKEAIEEMPSRITKVHLRFINGQYIGTYGTDEAIKEYGHMLYHSGYSDGYTVVSLWIFNTTK